MTEELEIVEGSGNVFDDLGLPDAEIEHVKCEIAAEILSVLEDRELSARAAAKELAVDHADIVRVRNADLGRFTIDRLLRILAGLNRRMQVSFSDLDGDRAA